MAIAIEQLQAQEIANLDREEVVKRLLHFGGRVPLDFTPEFLAEQSIEHLRHILLAAHKHITH